MGQTFPVGISELLAFVIRYLKHMSNYLILNQWEKETTVAINKPIAYYAHLNNT